MSEDREVSRYDTEEFVGATINKRMDMWLNSCLCDEGESPYCTYCTILWDARERMELLESILCAKAFDNGASVKRFQDAASTEDSVMFSMLIEESNREWMSQQQVYEDKYDQEVAQWSSLNT